jgi:hypothetical protein
VIVGSGKDGLPVILGNMDTGPAGLGARNNPPGVDYYLTV